MMDGFLQIPGKQTVKRGKDTYAVQGTSSRV